MKKLVGKIIYAALIPFGNALMIIRLPIPKTHGQIIALSSAARGCSGRLTHERC
jgi:hypothetical protein